MVVSLLLLTGISVQWTEESKTKFQEAL